MDSHVPSRRKALEDALQEFLNEYREALEAEEISEILQEVSESLCEPEGPTVRQIGEEPPRFELVYPTAPCLERDLSQYLDLRGLVLPLASSLPLLSDVIVEIRLAGLNDVISLDARIVQHTPRGIAIEIARADEVTRQRLRQLPTKQASHEDTIASGRTTLQGPPLVSAPTRPCEAQVPTKGELVVLHHEPAGRWQLEQVPFERVLLDVMAHRGWGVVQIERPDLCRQIVTHNGHIIDVQSDPAPEDEDLGHLLLQARQLDERQLEQARDYAQKHHTDLADALVAMQILSYRKLLLTMKSRMSFLLEKIWKEGRGLARYYPLPHPPQHYIAPPLAIGARVLSHVFAAYAHQSDEDLQALCESRYAHRLIAAASPLPMNVDELGLDTRAQKFLEALQSHPRPLKATLDLAGDRAKGTVRSAMAMLLTFDQLNLLVVTRDRTTPVAATGADKARLEEIQHFYARILQDDHFAILGLHWSAYDQEIQQAYLKLTQTFAVGDRLIDTAMKPQLVAIGARIQKAYDGIAKPAKRAAYRAALIDRHTIRNALDMLRRQAETAKLQRDIDTAIDACCRIVELDPDDEQARNDLKQLRPIKLRNSLSRK